MNMQTYTNIRGQLQAHESLARLNTWYVGGPAKQTYRPADLADLCEFLKTLPPDEPIIWLGLGSNVLIRDKGINGTVILTHSGLNEMQIDGTHIRVEAGVTCAKLAKFCAKHGLSGGCFFAGIPGTVGGALAMNAGAFGGETWECVEAVETVDRQGQRHHRNRSEFEIAYREVKGPPNEWFVAAHIQLPKTADIEAEQQKIRALVKERREKQPIGEPSCGSVFRNPPGKYAAQLIEACGLKGFSIGGALVSKKHANFIINTGNASAAEIEALILHIQQQVFAKEGVQLRTEVHILGE
jgi:UDP-N-acetylmuramate dehydrogenase